MRYGPAETGCLRNAAPFLSPAAGRIGKSGCVSSYVSAVYGCLRWNVTLSPADVTEAIGANRPALTFFLSFSERVIVATTSLPVSGEPSENLRFDRSVNVT